MFIKYDCGCIGIELRDGSKFTVVVCDAPWEGVRDEPFMIEEGMRTCRGEPNALPLDEEKSSLIEMGKLITEGYKFREIKHLLK